MKGHGPPPFTRQPWTQAWGLHLGAHRDPGPQGLCPRPTAMSDLTVGSAHVQAGGPWERLLPWGKDFENLSLAHCMGRGGDVSDAVLASQSPGGGRGRAGRTPGTLPAVSLSMQRENQRPHGSDWPKVNPVISHKVGIKSQDGKLI